MHFPRPFYFFFSYVLFGTLHDVKGLRIEIDTGENPLLPNPLPDLISKIFSHGSSESEEANSLSQFNPNHYPRDVRTVRYLIVMTRHGSRSPTFTYPTDPYPFEDPNYWPDGPGQLTKFGKQQLYASGQTLRMRYNAFLNLNYYPDDNAVRCNRYDRDFMSAACMLAGLYPPVGYQLWNPVILWQPIPIWEDPFDVADIASNNTLCPRYSAEQDKALNLLNANSGKYTGLLSYLSKNTGLKLTRISQAVGLFDTLSMQEENGYKLPKWTKSVFPKKLEPLFATTFATLVAGTPEMIRLGGGPILSDISRQMIEKSEGKMTPDRLIYIDAVHDTTLQILLASLGYTNAFHIETSAFMVFELHETPSHGFTVQIAYFNSSAHVEPNILEPPNCPYPCTLSKFAKFVKSITPSNWDAECNSLDN